MSKTSKKLDRNTIQRVLQLIRPYKGMVILTLTLALITVVTTLLAPVLAGRAVDKIVGPGQVDYQGLAASHWLWLPRSPARRSPNG